MQEEVTGREDKSRYSFTNSGVGEGSEDNRNTNLHRFSSISGDDILVSISLLLSEAVRMPQVFISYAHVSPDQELAAELHRAIETNGFDIFVDTKIRLGQNWAEQIDVQLRGSTHFVALLSAASAKSDMVRREIAIAYKLSKANKLVILPVRLGLSEELPYELSAYLDLIQYTTWRPGESFEAVCRTILDAISGCSPANGVITKPTNSKRFAETELEPVKAQLARYLGPVARIVVDRAAKKANSWEQLYDLLASEIPSDEERRRFQATFRR